MCIVLVFLSKLHLLNLFLTVARVFAFNMKFILLHRHRFLSEENSVSFVTQDTIF